jgi:hypothetical protein
VEFPVDGPIGGATGDLFSCLVTEPRLFGAKGGLGLRVWGVRETTFPLLDLLLTIVTLGLVLAARFAFGF